MSAAELLAEEDTVASVCMASMEALLGPQWRSWEPETLWLELDHKKVDVTLGNRQQIMAGRSLLITGRFFFDALVYDRTCAAFSNEELNFDVMGESTVAYMAWAVDEMRRICDAFEDPPLDWDYEVENFTAHQLHEEGFIIAPEELAFAQKALDRLYPAKNAAEHKELKDEVRKLWSDLGDHDVRKFPYPETAKGVQLAHLAGVHTYVRDRQAKRKAQLARVLG